jgi:hypothetical protein
MATENDFLPFAVGADANVLSQSAYAGLTSILQSGFQSGIANSQQLNKVWRQSSIMAAVLAQFIVNNSGQPAIDDGTTATLLANLQTAVAAASRAQVILPDTGTANAYAAANPSPLTALPTSSGLIQRINVAHANTGASTFAPDGLTAKPVYGLGLQPLQGGELVVNGIATLLYVVASSVNGGNGAWVLLECTGGPQQIAPATQSQHAVQLGQVSGVVGQSRNLSSVVSTAASTKTVTADELIVESALGGLRYCLSNLNLTGNLATQMDTGSAPVSGFVAEYVIYNPDAPISSTNPRLLYQNATTTKVPEVYSGANMPAGYTASALVSVWPTNSSGQFVAGVQNERSISTLSSTVLNSTTSQAPFVSLSIAGAVPPNAVSVSLRASVSSSATAYNGSMNVASSSSGIGAQTVSVVSTAANTTGVANMADIKIIGHSQTIYYNSAISGGTPTYVIAAYEYKI